MICTKKDGYLRKLINSDLMISWMATLSSGATVYGDYDRPDMDNPWYRLRDHCKETGDTINKIELYMFGAESMVFFEICEHSLYHGIGERLSLNQGYRASFPRWQYL